MKFNFFTKKNGEPNFAERIHNLTTIRPRNIRLYHTAFTHRNYAKEKNVESNENLEFLGDSILSSVISVILYRKFPDGDEGLLTDMRSKIVNRKNLNRIGTQMGLSEMMKTTDNQTVRGNSNILGNAVESLIGAIFLDRGYSKCQKFIKKAIIKPYIDIDDLVDQVHSHKNLVLNWAAQNNEYLVFKDVQKSISKKRFFEVSIYDSQNLLLGKATAKSKKEASQLASEEAIEYLRGKGRWR